MKRPLFEINIDRAAVFVGVLALVLLMHVIIGWRFANLNTHLETYNEQLTDQVDINHELLARLQDQNKLINLSAQVDMDQSVSITRTWDMLWALKKEAENAEADATRNTPESP